MEDIQKKRDRQKRANKKYRSTEHGKRVSTEYNHMWRNSERGKEILQEYRDSGKTADYNKDYYLKNKTVLDEEHKEYKKTEAGKMAILRANVRKRQRHKESRPRLVTELGGKCSICGFDNPKSLVVDHINGGGRVERRKMGGHKFYWHYLNHLDEARKKLQVLCSNCNMIKWYDKTELVIPAHSSPLSISRK